MQVVDKPTCSLNLEEKAIMAELRTACEERGTRSAGQLALLTVTDGPHKGLHAVGAGSHIKKRKRAAKKVSKKTK